MIVERAPRPDAATAAPSPRPRARRVLTAVVLGATAVAAVAVAPSADASARHRPHRQVSTAYPVVQHLRFTDSEGEPERAALLRFDVGHGLRLGTVMASGRVGGARETVLSMGRRTGAVAGLNGDFFDLYDDNSPPRGGMVDGGVIVKSTRPLFNANFYVTSDGRAHIGNPRFRASITVGTGRTGIVRHTVFSINTPTDARNGQLTLITSRLARAGLKGCATATLPRALHGTSRVTSVDASAGRSFSPLAGNVVMLAGCGAAAKWLRANVHSGATVAVSTGFVVGAVDTLVSGGRVLLADGRPYRDPTGEVLAYDDDNPLTYGCVAADGHHVTLGVVDGRSDDSYGLRYSQLQTFLQHRLHCWSAMVFDGGGSTTLVDRAAASKSITVANEPADYGEGLRPVADGLFVYARR